MTSQEILKKRLIKAWRNALRPPKKQTVSEWADNNRQLTTEGSAEPGQWDTSRAEYQRGIMDSVTDPLIQQVVVMKSAQVGWTEIINNIVGYFIENDPCPMMVIQPTENMCEAWSKDRFTPMVKATESLLAKCNVESKSSGNTILHKVFKGGHLTLVGANASSGLASRPIRLVLPDEVDRYPLSAGQEGDPISLAWARAKTFHNKKMLMGSTPTNKGRSRIEEAWNESDKRRYFVPCPDCGFMQYLKWSNIRWPQGRRDLAHYVCEDCGIVIPEGKKHFMVANGEWRATAEFNGIAGFHIWEAYSPWSTWASIAVAHKKAMGNVERMRVWTNTVLGETFEEDGETVDDGTIYSRREIYKAEVPLPVVYITAGVDVQKDRLEVEIKGYGRDSESWSIDYKVLYGNPERPDVWKDLDRLWDRRFHHENGGIVQINAACIDSGNWTQNVYQYCKGKRGQKIFCTKGKEGFGRPATSAPSKKQTGENRRPVELYILGVDVIKQTIFGRLRMKKPGPGYMHFPAKYERNYYQELTAERVIQKKRFGQPYDVWEKTGKNEVLDCNVMAEAALLISNPDLELLADEQEKTGFVPVAEKPRERRMLNKGIA